MVHEHIRSAVIISAGIHALVVSSLAGIRTESVPVEPEKPIEVEYVKIERPEPPIVEPVPETVEDELPPEPPIVEEVTNTDIAPSEQIAAPEPEQAAAETAPSPDAKKQAEIRSAKDYINYYSLIREKIRRRVRAGYRRYYGEGDVTLNFTLNSGGGLVSGEVDASRSTNDHVLHDIAVTGLRQAAPYPHFPDALPYQELSFDLTITFKRK